MTPLRRFPALAFALSLVAIAGFCVASESFGLLVVAGALAAMSWYVTEGPRGRTLPRWVANILLIAAVLNAGVDWAQRGSTGEVMDVVGRFTLWLTIIKLYESKGVRDYGQLLALGAVLMVAGALQSVQLSFAILLLVYVVLGLYVVLLFQLHVAYERTRTARRVSAPADAKMVPAVQPAIGQNLGRSFGGLGAALALTTFLISGAVFVAFPRGVLVAESAFGAGRRQAGFTDEVRLRDNPRIGESRREVFTVEMRDPQGAAMKSSEPLRLRGAVLDQYSPVEARWTSSRQSRDSSRTLASRGLEEFVPLGERAIDTRVQTFTQIVKMRSMASNTLFASYAPVAFAAEAGRDIAFEPSTLMLRELREKSGASLGWSSEYRLKVQPFPTAETMYALSGEAGTQSTPANHYSPVVFQIAKQILVGKGIDPQPGSKLPPDDRMRWRLAVARAIVEELHSPRFQYTTDLSDFVVGRGEDPTLIFLTKHRFGHCEHFAAAMVALCRSVGVEARLITGYIAMEYDDSAQHYIVRESNAHAWVEVRTGTSTWATFDPTPPATLEAINEAGRTWIDNWRWMYDRVEFMWNNRFVGFDGSTQATLAERLSDRWLRRFQEALAAMREATAGINAAFRLGPAGYIWLGLLGMVMLVAVAALVSVARRRATVRRVAGLERAHGRAGRRLVEQLGFYADALALLRGAGLPKPQWQTPQAFAGDVAARRPDLKSDVGEVVETFYAVRYGGAPLDEARGARIRDVLAGLGRKLGDRSSGRSTSPSER
jgi:Ca2+/Na+ antiporter